MRKGFQLTAVILAVILFNVSLPAQEATDEKPPEKQFNTLYDTEAVINRLSYENFKSIKLLRTAIFNYGKGESQFEELVNDYARASALYYRKEYIKSANLFTQNEKNIQDVATQLAKQYKETSEKLHIDVIKMGVKHQLKSSIEKQKPNATVEALISNASYAIHMANDYLVRSHPIDAIFYFRRAKENCFKVYEILKIDIPDTFEKDMVDLQNEVYVEKEKMN
jgi:hypothetical protein